ncbi:methionine ABC transporter ATP-binding protein [Quadrisphaera sp. DSM 44207]|uniref:methionine ABC transporter ATP-binding protein n=1 Tax=Quadrisphaera sp. DSM 44207 TaxID=1881057 RepID=UPI0008860DB5|nr:ATP-binding cassette domain-containing protein [Quadrisphaera sp. DSM 44207]SDQ32764.1 ABC-type methionine transport system, ATPase component [Quadrisphaera sp. DSM 44207]
MIELDQLTKAYGHGPGRTVVLDHLDLTVRTGEIVAIVGPSGAGKSTLAQCVNLLERPTSGSVVVGGVDLSSLGERRLRAARRQIGTIFQSDGLQSRRTAEENVALPLRYLGVTPAERRRRVAELLDRVGLADRARHYPHQLSGGQRQRVGIARALALRPSVLLADEATSGLDPEATASVVALVRQLRDELGLSILFITHEMDVVVDVADRAARLEAGRIGESGRVVDLLRDPSSALGAALLGRREDAGPARAGVWSVTYRSPDVPGDWLVRASLALNADVALLDASVGAVGGQTVGRATVRIDERTDPVRVEGVLRALGLAPGRGAGSAPAAAQPPAPAPSAPDAAARLEPVA